ncbi:putative [histone H3]-lysine(4) N-trimethyltransferase chromatin regulator PHD family [Helianthus annuus]|nr:putative [histone H3]-lysine(4) N-trimethyltransferase chromatin regulator PHD family [Helianthus annuus]
MENKLHGLPPHKRFNLIHQQKPTIHPQDFNFPSSSCLPAKKRKETRDPSPIPANLEPPTTTTAGAAVCLPAKKRICALHPNLFLDKPFSSFDLNLEYDPRSDHDQENVQEKNQENVQEKDQENGYVDDWFCSKCKSSGKSKVGSLSCCLCPVTGGALKPTVDGRWAHIVCALFIPEVFFGDPEGREGVDCSKVVARRWGGKCYVCKKLDGCVIDCSEEKCCLRFHVTCGLKEDLCIEYKQGRNKGAIVAGFCKTHTDLWMKQQATGKFKIVARNED